MGLEDVWIIGGPATNPLWVSRGNFNCANSINLYHLSSKKFPKNADSEENWGPLSDP
jgi:hypothetical protein